MILPLISILFVQQSAPAELQTHYAYLSSHNSFEPIGISVSGQTYVLSYGDVEIFEENVFAYDGYKTFSTRSPAGFDFSIPVSFQTNVPFAMNDIQAWQVGLCYYSVKSGVPIYLKENTTYYYEILGTCENKDFVEVYIFSSDTGLASFSKGRIDHGKFLSDTTYFAVNAENAFNF